MGMLAKAKESKSAQPQESAEAPDANAAADEEAPGAPAEQPEAGGDGDGAAAPAQPQGPEGDGGDAGQDAGAGDEGGAPAEDQEDGQEGGAQGGPPGGDGSEDSSAPPGGQDNGHVDLTQLPVSPALKEEIARANAALYTALYTNDKVANAVMNGIAPSGPHKIESVARMATLLVVQINKQLKFIHDAPQIVLPFTQDVVAHILDLASEVKKITFTDQEAQACLGTALELMLHATGVSKKQVQALQHCLPRSQIMDGVQKYHQHLAYIKGAREQINGPGGAPVPGGDQNGAQPNPGDQAPPGGDQSANGGSPQAGGAGADQSAAPDQSQGQPQPGAPVTAAPGPGQSAPPGGMLSQAAAQPPQGG